MHNFSRAFCDAPCSSVAQRLAHGGLNSTEVCCRLVSRLGMRGSAPMRPQNDAPLWLPPQQRSFARASVQSSEVQAVLSFAEGRSSQSRNARSALFESCFKKL